MAKQLTRDDIILPVLAAWAHDEISIGRARELLRWPDDKIRREAEIRVSNAVKEKEYRETLEYQRDNLAMMLRRVLHRMKRYETGIDDFAPADQCKLMEQAHGLLLKYGIRPSVLRSEP